VALWVIAPTTCVALGIHHARLGDVLDIRYEVVPVPRYPVIIGSFPGISQQ